MKRSSMQVKLNLRNFRLIRNQLKTNVAKLLCTLWFFHMCCFVLPLGPKQEKVSLNPFTICSKEHLRYWTKKPLRYHNCHITAKCNLLAFDDFVHLANSCLLFLLLLLLLLPHTEFVSLCSNKIRQTRASTRDNFKVRYRSTELGWSSSKF